jgi:Uncharacterised nucleotidyltransferase
MQAGLRPEADLLIQICTFVCSAHSSRKTNPRADQLLSGQLDWPYIVRTIELNGIIPIVSRWMSLTSPGQVPFAVKRKIALTAEANALRNEHLSGELLRIIGSFSKNGIDAIALKGPTLAALAYGDVSMRTFADLDLLVHSSDLARAVRILVSGGYAAAATDDRRADSEIFSAFPTSFEAKRGGVFVDVHWQVGPTRIRFFPDEDSLWARSVLIDFQGTQLRSFSPADQIIYLCAHATKHGWTELSMVCDVAGLIERSGVIDWDQLVAEAKRLHGLRMTLLGMYLAGQLMQADIPEPIMRLAHADSEVEALATQIIPAMFIARELKLEPANTEAIALRSMELKSDRIRYWFYRSITPTMGDWTFLPLPRLLYPAYFIIRPLRFALMPMRKAFGARAAAKS